MSFISLTNVSREYTLGSTTVPALKNINLTIEKGEFTAIWGPSGSGKSTLLNILATIDKPNHGSYQFSGKDVGTMTDKALTTLRQQHIGIIFQNFNLIPVLSALENVMLPVQVGRFKIENLQQRAMALLEEVGVANYAKHRPDHLSGGQRQRVAIARALISNPDFVIADEPTANLDSETSDKIIQLMADLNEKHNTTFLFSTHHHMLIASAKRTIHLLDGEILDKPAPHLQAQPSLVQEHQA